MNDRMKLLFVLLVILAMLRFGLAPWLQWQEDKHQEIILLQKRTSKGLAILNNQQAFSQQLAELESAEEQLRQSVFAAEAESAFQLARQREIEQLLNTFELKADRISWMASVPVVGAPLWQHTASFSIDGKTENIVRWHLAMEQQNPVIHISTFDVRLERQTSRSLGRARAEYRLVFYAMHAEQGGGDAGK
ncbi:hypothetical protein [Bowmanella dokdonensis]|uniref:Uncharacterized protein n=1 Tax=Bowmanella dokdonensis TaxID=751969 RepID=A0A939DRV5_9ALTE|nr:hypothetical protein [Bowmanella dokdonensis]MBN7827528.1 hypothetical protein [Bowmanella dokdonensis]